MSKMSRGIRFIAILLILVLVAGLVTGIAVFTANYEPPSPEPGLYIDGQRVENPGIMLSVGENDISFDDYRYYYLMNKTYAETMDTTATKSGDAYWLDDPDGSKALNLKKTTETGIQQIYAWLHIAADTGIELSEEEHAEVQATLTEQKEALGDQFDQRLKDMYLTDEAMYIRITEQQMLAQKAMEAYYDLITEQNKQEIMDGTMATAKHILIGIDAEAEDPEEEDARAKALAEELYQQIEESDDPDATFDALMNEYSTDPGLETNPDGYTFGEGEMVDEFYTATMALPVDGISEPVKSTYGYHIIHRLPLDEAYVEENIDSMVESKVEEIVTENFDAVVAVLPITPGEYYDAVKPTSII